MMKNVKKATPELATSTTIVWWDMDSCPLPNGYEPSRVGPRIDTELKNQGYNGPLTIIGIGSDMMSCVRRALFSREPRFEPPLSMMLITAVHAELLEDVICVFFNRGPRYNLLLAFPAVTEHADPEPPTLLVDNFGGEWVWDRLGLLKDPGSPNYDTRRQDTGCESHCCGLCDDFSSDSFDDFKAHLDSPQHADKGKKFKAALLCKSSSLKKKSTAKPKKPSKASFSNKSTDFSLTNLTSKDILLFPWWLQSKRLETAEEAECSLPKNATTMSS
uniref:NYN domain-containing protein n=1 Tax=Brassica campestris TaxID=3711 RepID=M4F5S8_BRACM